MSDEPVVEELRFTQSIVLVVEQWPMRIALSDDFMKRPHLQKATINEDDTVTFTVDNGTATYRIRRDRPRYGRAVVADLVEGDTPSRLRQRAQKFGGV